jgi:hypothetical protein
VRAAYHYRAASSQLLLRAPNRRLLALTLLLVMLQFLLLQFLLLLL